MFGTNDASVSSTVGVSSRGTMNRDNRTESLGEANLPLRGSLGGRVQGSQRCSEVSRVLWRFFRGFQRFSEIFTGFHSCSEVFRDFSETLSEADFPLRGSQSCCP